MRRLLEETAGLAADYLEGTGERPVGWSASVDELRSSLGMPLPEMPTDPREVIAQLAAAAGPGLVASPGGRYFGFVIGGAVAAARHAVLARVGWDVNEHGLIGAPMVHVVVGAERHATVDRALRFLGLGTGCIVPVAADGQGRMMPEALRETLAGLSGPTIVCAQAGNVNTGSFDPLEEIADLSEAAGAWLHIDGAFGLWAAASPALRHLVAGADRADSWTTDAHSGSTCPTTAGSRSARTRRLSRPR